jgi:hypothetical protein
MCGAAETYDEIRKLGAANQNDPACTPWLRGRVPECPSAESLAWLSVTFNNTDMPSGSSVRRKGRVYNRELHVAAQLANTGNHTVQLAGARSEKPLDF